jgi:uncharacterized RDD family membrane protein YckC
MADITEPGKAPPGWYSDHSGRPGLRWWDGSAWTDHLHPDPIESKHHWLVSNTGERLLLASWWRRVGGSVLDGLIIGIPTAAIEALVGAIFYSGPQAFGFTGHNPDMSHPVRILLGVSSSIVAIFYAVWLIGRRGQTVGMKAVGVKAVVKESGGRLPWPKVWRRELTVVLLITVWTQAGFIVTVLGEANGNRHDNGALLSLVGYVLSAVTYLWPLGNPANQTLQDKSAGSIVVDAR